MKTKLRPLLAVNLLLPLIGILITSMTMAQTWQYHQVILFNELGGINNYNKQYIITLDTECPIGMGLMLQNGDDIRFSHDLAMSDSVGYFILGGINTKSTRILLQIDSLLQNETDTVYMFYGNPIALPASSPNFLIGPFSSVDSVAPVTTNPAPGSGWTRGYKFNCLHTMLVPSFGSNTPNGGLFYGSLWTSSGSLLTQKLINPVSGGIYTYFPLDSAVILYNSMQYVATLHSPTNQAYYYGTPTTTNTHLTYVNMQYSNGTTPTTFPTSTLTGQNYGIVDFLYYLMDLMGGVTVTVEDLLFMEEDTICAGESYTFPDGSTTSNIMAPITHLSVLTSSTSCDSVIETSISVKPLDINVLQSGTMLTAAASGAVYQWLDCDNGFSPISGQNSKSFTATANGNYAVIVTQNGCVDTSLCANVTSIGIEETGLSVKISVYPNPANNKVNIDWKNNEELVIINIANGMGQQVTNQAIYNSSSAMLDISGLSAGVYVLDIMTGKETYKIKLKKE